MSHPCDNEAWLRKHYVDLVMTTRDCAQEAGVSHQTIYKWLEKHGVSIRTRADPRRKPNFSPEERERRRRWMQKLNVEKKGKPSWRDRTIQGIIARRERADQV